MEFVGKLHASPSLPLSPLSRGNSDGAESEYKATKSTMAKRDTKEHFANVKSRDKYSSNCIQQDTNGQTSA